VTSKTLWGATIVDIETIPVMTITITQETVVILTVQVVHLAAAMEGHPAVLAGVVTIKEAVLT
jgi:hypothetical protein